MALAPPTTATAPTPLKARAGSVALAASAFEALDSDQQLKFLRDSFRDFFPAEHKLVTAARRALLRLNEEMQPPTSHVVPHARRDFAERAVAMIDAYGTSIGIAPLKQRVKPQTSTAVPNGVDAGAAGARDA